jgi:hypothetical protein
MNWSLSIIFLLKILFSFFLRFISCVTKTLVKLTEFQITYFYLFQATFQFDCFDYVPCHIKLFKILTVKKIIILYEKLKKNARKTRFLLIFFKIV